MTNERNYEAIAFRIRKTGNEYVVEEQIPNGNWMLLEILPSLEAAECAYHAYEQEGHTVKWFV